jgi:hypothetical protein
MSKLIRHCWFRRNAANLRLREMANFTGLTVTNRPVSHIINNIQHNLSMSELDMIQIITFPSTEIRGVNIS